MSMMFQIRMASRGSQSWILATVEWIAWTGLEGLESVALLENEYYWG